MTISTDGSAVGGKLRSMTRFALFLLITAACGGDSKPKPAAPASRTAADLGPMCDRYYVRQRSCANDYLRALVQMRVEYDMPQGIAAHVKDVGLDAVVAEANVEYERDHAPDQTAALCKAMAERTPPDQVERLLADGDRCEAMTDCAAFAKCAIDTERSYVKEGRQH